MNKTQMLLKKKFYATLLLILFSRLEASHYMGIDAYYVCLGNGIYRIYLRVYGDCASTLTVDDPPGQGGLSETFISVPANCGIPLGPWVKVPTPIPNTDPPDSTIYPDVTPLCPGSTLQTTCFNSSSPIPGTREILFYRDFNLSSCQTFQIRFESCCRNNAINNLQNPGSLGIGYSLTINRQLASCNSSPYFTLRPVPYLCRNELSSINQGAIDPDGDSLVFRLCSPLDDNFAPCPFIAPMNFNNPFPAAFGAVFNTTTGTMTLMPTLNNWKGVYTVCIDEYRNGQLIGTVSRDMQITVIDCIALSQAFGFGPQSPPNATGFDSTSSYSKTVCVNTPIETIIYANDLDTDEVKMSWNNAIQGASFITSNVFVLNNFAIFQWTPTQPGTYQFVVNVLDNHCPLNATNQYAYVINVVPPIDTTSYGFTVQCNDVIFNVNATGGSGPLSYQWSSPVGNSNQQNPTFTFGGPGQYPITLTITDTLGCEFVLQDTVEITPDDGVTINAGVDITYCNGTGPFQLGSPPAPNQTYSWSPSTGLSNSNISNPTVSLSNTGTSPITVDYVLTSTKFNCVVTDTVRVTVYPSPVASITPSKPAYCIGDTVTLTGPTGMNQYLWTTGDTTQSIQFVATSSTSVSLAVRDSSACMSNFVSYFVQVYPIPTATIAGPDSICPASSTTLTAFGSLGYLWNDGSTNNSITVTPTQSGTTYWVIPIQNGCLGDTVFHTINFFNLPTPTVQPTNVQDQCMDGNSFTFTASGGQTYYWVFGSGAFPAISTQPSVTVTYLSPGVKTVKLVAYNNGCISDTIYRTFEVSPMPKVDFIPPASQCFAGHNFDFQGLGFWGGNPRFFWDFGPNATPSTSSQQNPQNVRFDQPGTYPVTFFVVENGCTSNVVTKDVTVYVTPPAPTVTTDSTCQGYAVVVSAATTDPTLLIEWFRTPNATSPFFIGTTYSTPQLNQSVTYYIGTVNSDSCRSTTRTPLYIKVFPSPSIQIQASSDTVYLPNAVVEFIATVPSNVKTWLWTFGDGSQSTLPNPAYQYTQEGTYSVTLTVVDSNGCINSLVENQYIVVKKDLKVLIPSAFTPNGDGINDFFNITTKYITSIQIVIFDRLGREVFESDDLHFQWNGTDHNTGKALPEGVYTYRLKVRDFEDQVYELAGSITLLR